MPDGLVIEKGNTGQGGLFAIQEVGKSPEILTSQR